MNFLNIGRTALLVILLATIGTLPMVAQGVAPNQEPATDGSPSLEEFANSLQVGEAGDR